MPKLGAPSGSSGDWRDDPWADDAGPPGGAPGQAPRRFGAGCLIAMIVSALGIVLAAVLVARAIGAAFSGSVEVTP